MKHSLFALAPVCSVSLFLAAPVLAAECPPDSVQVGPHCDSARPERHFHAKCPPDSVRVGQLCVDKYEASVWSIDPEDKNLIKKVQQGKATLDDLIDGGATQHGCAVAPYHHTAFPASFPLSGNWTAPLYAVSVPGVLPSTCITWFQAEQACALVGKRLLTNQEWQQAAARTPDGAPCNVSSGIPGFTGTPSCVSAWGAFDMVGNVWEWVADWVPLSTACVPSLFGTGDVNCLAGASQTLGPAALIRGGGFGGGKGAGVFALSGQTPARRIGLRIGFRCGRAPALKDEDDD